MGQHKAESEIHKHKLTTTTTTTTTTMKSSLAAILALGLCLSQGTLTKADGSANFLRDVGADTALLFGNHDLSDQILGSENNRRKLQDGSANFLRDVGADTALLFGNHDL